MKQACRSLSLCLYFFASLLFMEVVLRAVTTATIVSMGFLISLLFSLSIVAFLFVILSFFKAETTYKLSLGILALGGVLFSSQLIYYTFFRTFYSVYSAGNATQILDFWQDILMTILKQSFWLLLLFLPMILLAKWGKNRLNFAEWPHHTQALLICFMLVSHAFALVLVNLNGKEQHSAYDLYFNSSYPILSAERLGLITTMRLDLQRLTFGWSPNLTDSPSSLPSPSFEKEEEKDYQTMDIDFKTLQANETNKTLKRMHQYFSQVEPTAKNSYTGKYEGYNLIFITAESFSPYAVHQDVTPTLYKMVNEGYHFTNFYNPSWEVSTSDGEYVATTGLIPKKGVWSYFQSGDNHMPFAMGNQLKKLGYKTTAYHNHTYDYYNRDVSHPNMGYDYKGVGNGLEIKESWPASDLEMMEKTIPSYIDNQPFHTYYMTVSGHMQYNFPGNNMASKNKQAVDHLPYSDQAKAYLATQVELDKALEHLLAKLKEAGIADKTLIAMSADHFPYGLDDKTINELAGHEVEKNFELYKSPFLLYADGMEPVTIDKPASSLDIIPTLSNLLGLEYDSRLLMGRDIFSDSAPLVTFLNKSFITDKGRYNAATGEFTAHEKASVEEDYVKTISAMIDNKFYYSTKILDTDYYRHLFQKEQ
ncbi:LTA synthase family protein [Thalassobacillus sp. CUG 92003]|uniref:LTA synthase family protein n=1 Tax=Thalassobacillus sp. CUG 92003 TaxID=2736641 RepID=UPI0015E734F6|nr:alkaline phosphatase family protein [Thalassobacillus sp. CUG 92003]